MIRAVSATSSAGPELHAGVSGVGSLVLSRVVAYPVFMPPKQLQQRGLAC